MKPIDRILLLCEERGVKQAYINNLIGGYRGKVTDWKNNKSSPSDDDLKVIADYFNVTVDYLRGNTHDPQVEIIPADPEKVRRHEERREQQREESYEKLVEGIKKLLPDVEQPISAEDMEIARRLNSLPPEKRALVLDHLDQLEQNDI